MRIIEILNKAMRKKSSKFVAACYRELLNREPDPSGMQHHLHLLEHKKASRQALLEAFLTCPEAVQLYEHGTPNLCGTKRPSPADLLKHLYKQPAAPCIESLYRELLGRSADKQGRTNLRQQLAHGTPRQVIVVQMLRSRESQELLTAPN